MNSVYILVYLAVFVGFTGAVHAQEASRNQYNETNLELTAEQSARASGGESGEKGGTEDINIGVGELQATSETSAGTEVTSGETETKGNVEVEWKVEKGESLENTGIEPDEIDVSAEAEAKKKGNVEVNWKVEEGESAAQGDESALDFVQQRAEIRVRAAEVRGWDPEQKRQYAAEAKAWAQVRSGQDLEHFAQGILADNEQIESLSLNYEEIKARHRHKAKFLGLFNASISQDTTIGFGDDERGRVPERVQVKFPWYRFLFKVENELNSEDIQNLLNQPVVETEPPTEPAQEVSADAELSVYAQALEKLSAILKARL